MWGRQDCVSTGTLMWFISVELSLSCLAYNKPGAAKSKGWQQDLKQRWLQVFWNKIWKNGNFKCSDLNQSWPQVFWSETEVTANVLKQDQNTQELKKERYSHRTMQKMCKVSVQAFFLKLQPHIINYNTLTNIPMNASTVFNLQTDKLSVTNKRWYECKHVFQVTNRYTLTNDE